MTSKTKTATQILTKLIIGIKSGKIHSDHLFLLQIYFQETRNNQVSQMNRTPPYEALFGGESRAGLARMNLGDLENRVSTAEQLLEVLDDNNEEEEDAEEVEATLDNNDNARLNIREDINRKKTFSFGHCPNEGRGGPNFLALFEEVQFWSIKRVCFFKNANLLNF